MSFKKSAWKLESWSGYGVGSKVISAETGTLELKEPPPSKEKEGNVLDFNYVGVGTGLGLPISISIAPGFFPSGGSVFLLPQFDGEELTEDDIQGAFLLYELSSIFGAGGSLALMFVGGNAAYVPLILAAVTAPGGIGNLGLSEALTLKFYLSFTGVVWLRGASFGYGAGISGYFGYLN